jgi:hypothetical protein
MPPLPNNNSPDQARVKLGKLALGLLACALLGLASALGGENPTADPPPLPPGSIIDDGLSPLPSASRRTSAGPLAFDQPDQTARWESLRDPQPSAAHVSHQSPQAGRHPAAEAAAEAAAGHAGKQAHSVPPSAVHDPAESWVEGYDAAPMEDLWLVPKLFRPDAYGRHRGEGEPLLDASWLNRPYFAGFFLGALEGDTLIADQIDQSIGFFYGFRLGWDYDIYWGLETRLGFSELGLDFVNDPTIVGLSTDIVIWDASLVYYPWGDSRWRPYVSLGIGLVDFDFLDENALRQSDAVVGVPLGFGLKYRHSDWITLRFDLTDNIALGQRADYETMNNLSLAAGFEFRFGGTRKSYFPWNPSRTLR